MGSAAKLYRVRFFLAFLLFALSGISFLDRTNISIAGIQIGEEFGLGNQRLGWIFSAFLIGYAGFQVPAGWLAARYGPRKMLTLSTLWWGVSTALVAVLPSSLPNAIFLLIMIRLMLGAGESVMYPAANQFVARWIPVRERGLINGLIFAGVGAGSGLTPPMLNWIISHDGWRGAFYFSSLLGIAVGILWWVTARDTPAEQPNISGLELGEIESGLRVVRVPNGEFQDESRHRAEINWRKLLGRRDLPALMLGYFCFGYVSWIYFSWFFLYMAQVRGFELKASAQISMLPFLSMTFCCLAGGALSDWLTQKGGLRIGRCWTATGALLLTGTFLLLGSRAQSPLNAGLILACGAGALYISQSSFWSVAIDIADQSSGVFSSMVNMGGQIGGAVTASLTPWIAQHFGWTASFAVAAAVAALGGLCWLFVHPEQPLIFAPKSEQTQAA
jgi:ACS family glucarate transporter-like MFS transporter